MSIVNEILDVKCDEQALVLEWERIIRLGKSSKKLIRNAEKRGKSKNDPKYYNPACLERTGAIDCHEYIFLHKAIKYFKPTNILEVGTWFGTSANAMASALPEGGMVYTCDKYDLFVGERENIIYNNGWSSKFISSLITKGIKIDMVFWDAQFKDGDADKIIGMIKPFIFITHDYEVGEKGWRCVRELKKKFRDQIKIEQHGIIGLVTHG